MQIENIVPISLYDANKQKLVGVFETLALCARYIFGDTHNSKVATRVHAARSRKCRLNHNGMAYAIRIANEDQKALLGELEYVITNGYPLPTANNMASFHTSRICMAIDGNRILDRIRAADANKKNNERYI